MVPLLALYSFIGVITLLSAVPVERQTNLLASTPLHFTRHPSALSFYILI